MSYEFAIQIQAKLSLPAAMPISRFCPQVVIIDVLGAG